MNKKFFSYSPFYRKLASVVPSVPLKWWNCPQQEATAISPKSLICVCHAENILQCEKQCLGCSWRKTNLLSQTKHPLQAWISLPCLLLAALGLRLSLGWAEHLCYLAALQSVFLSASVFCHPQYHQLLNKKISFPSQKATQENLLSPVSSLILFPFQSFDLLVQQCARACAFPASCLFLGQWIKHLASLQSTSLLRGGLQPSSAALARRRTWEMGRGPSVLLGF